MAEAFIGTDFKDIRHYKEFEASPQGEWVDLDIFRDKFPPTNDWKWNSGFQVKAQVDGAKKIWYCEMRIPMASIGLEKPAKNAEMRINFYRCQGPPSNRKFIAWQPTREGTFHVPASFGRLLLQ